MDSLTDMNFEDLYLGTGINKMRTPDGVLKQIPDELLQDARDILQQCQETRNNKGRSEFAIKISKVKYRVTAMTNDAGVDLFVASKSGGKPRDITTLGLPKKALDMIRSPEAKGLILVLGGQGVGKTTAISSMIADRCRTFGHFGLTVDSCSPPCTRKQSSKACNACRNTARQKVVCLVMPPVATACWPTPC